MKNSVLKLLPECSSSKSYNALRKDFWIYVCNVLVNSGYSFQCTKLYVDRTQQGQSAPCADFEFFYAFQLFTGPLKFPAQKSRCSLVTLAQPKKNPGFGQKKTA